MMHASDSFDVAVVGGGPAGAAAAATLARSGGRVLLLERACRPVFKAGEGLPPAAAPLLRDIGIAQHLEGDGHRPSHGNESAWGGPELQSTFFLRDPHGPGWHLDRARFDARLRDAARCAGACVRTSIRVRRLAHSSRGWRLTLDENGRETRASAAWVIDCSGRSSWVSRAQGTIRVKHDSLVACVARFKSTADRVSDDIDSTTLVEAAPHGWWYTAVVPTRQRIVVYLTDATDRTARQARTADGFVALLGDSRHVRARLAGREYVITRRPTIVAADSSRLSRAAGDGWVAAGDAAVAFDPLSSQGILTALYSGLRAAQAVSSRLSGDRHALPAYVARVDAIYAAYLEQRHRYYSAECRWARHEFWRSRRWPRAAGRL